MKKIAIRDLAKNWQVPLDRLMLGLIWLHADQRDSQGRLTRQLGIKKPGGAVFRLKRLHYTNGDFQGFFQKSGDWSHYKRFSSTISVSTMDVEEYLRKEKIYE